jgi:uncharacterized membrane protein
MTRLHTFLRDLAGAAAVELAITAPVFLMLLLGLAEAGMLTWTQAGLQYAVESAARCASVDSVSCGSPQQVQAFAARKTLGVGVPASSFTITQAACGNLVLASYPYQLVTVFFGTPTVNLTAESCFAQQQ